MQQRTMKESIVALETHYIHVAKSISEIEDALQKHAIEAKSSHEVTQKQIQEIKDLINQGKGAYKLLVCVSSLVGGGIMGILTSFMNIFPK